MNDKNIKKDYYSQERIVENYEKFRFGGKYGKYISSLETGKIINMLKPELTKDKLLLDIPCGTGRLLKQIDSNSVKIFACDYSIPMIKMSKYNNKISAKYARTDVFNLPFKKDTFDIITSVRFLSHYSDTLTIIKNLTSILKNDGILIFDTYLWSPRRFLSFKLGGNVWTHSPNKINSIIKSIGNLEVVSFDSNFIISPLFHRYLPGFINKIFFKLEKFFNKKYLVRQYWKIRKI